MSRKRIHQRSEATEADVVDALTRDVPEIAFDIIQIVRVAIDGRQCKVAVTTKQPGVCVTGACVGVRGHRIRTIAHELGMDNIGIVAYSAHIETYLTNAIIARGAHPLSVHIIDAPGQVARMVFDAEDRSIGPTQFARAIGTRGSNVRLASALTGWQIRLCTPLCRDGHCLHPGATSLRVAS
ncbi:hypothetical protein A5722_01275 [Mycobacterium vulneris]|uniref:KH domain-containing protein n=1 Tax=Mycolicibacterium septicum DSM 44393 TaxID=1341646 RepID=A0A7X6MU70_9MYCO|nr:MULTISPECIES: hypothetical protein [Mycolicibacterium]MBX8690626.1 hypothetical protein [Mycobacterium sp. 20091114027_K0903767]MCP3811223.1 hypothetical protein [Mycobacteriaceae bacterium Msp059]OCB48630.1 hypothetical protein A5721_04570 [Mycolicibacterium vulneris]NKZ14972.1 hypothetical protein [Mycolicibacterium septicum DSM 44393]OBK04834.1 hypothetical protein A5637_11640 [Mycolicibacterium fortuitum]